MSTITWQRQPNETEKNQYSLKPAMYTAGAGLLVAAHELKNNRDSIPVIGPLLIIYAVFLFLRYLLMPSARKAPTIIDCSLEVFATGLLYTQNKIKNFILKKDIFLILSDDDSIAFSLNGNAGIKNKKGILVIDAPNLSKTEKDQFINEITANLPIENKPAPYLIELDHTTKKPIKPIKKSSKWPIYLGVGLVVVMVAATLVVLTLARGTG